MAQTDGERPVVPEVTVLETATRMREGNVQVIDVREPDEWEDFHAPQAKHVPLQTFLNSPGQYVTPGENVVFVCARGHRSAVAAEMASAVGLERAYNLEGGMNDWRERGYPVE